MRNRRKLRETSAMATARTLRDSTHGCSTGCPLHAERWARCDARVVKSDAKVSILLDNTLTNFALCRTVPGQWRHVMNDRSVDSLLRLLLACHKEGQHGPTCDFSRAPLFSAARINNCCVQQGYLLENTSAARWTRSFGVHSTDPQGATKGGPTCFANQSSSHAKASLACSLAHVRKESCNSSSFVVTIAILCRALYGRIAMTIYKSDNAPATSGDRQRPPGELAVLPTCPARRQQMRRSYTPQGASLQYLRPSSNGTAHSSLVGDIK